MKTYIYANSQIIAQHTGDHEADRYFYLHDRLGSVRQVIDISADVVKYYTYEPFGKTIEDGGTFDNPFRFTGQYFDSEIDEYYLRARQYDPHIARFTARDPVFGKFKEPLTLHVYLYCENDPLNLFDPDGSSSRSASMRIRQFTFEEYMYLWNNKSDPKQDPLWRIYADVGTTIVSEGAANVYCPGALVPVSAGSAFLLAGPKMYRILYYRLLQHGMINAILREDFGISSNLYDIQDYRAGL